ncbi:TonB-dependent receptor [Albibacterium sp.]|uniref:SusC/RagA family TonB-linked outer membrane protein n=1 Tax=Albibacterium sp. TaxID=2952885 RepID=UPI002BB60689|nr:TonB-dependent receptor [Albibacterium sp.]HUH19503.1 TonB-dependent receptor [Albibacterium sp.]
MKIITYCLTVSLFLFATNLLAQESITVKGVVHDAETGETVPGVTVQVKGTTSGTQTDMDGNYSIQVNPTATLVFSFISYGTQEIPVNNQQQIDVELVTSTQELEQVVVIGYGSAARRDLTGSISTVKGSEVADKPSSNPVASIQGKVAGVQIVNSGRPGADPDIRIRGTNSINSVKPLYVVDGILNDNINFINPADIETMEVLKDPSSLAIFGVRGANGVIIITTKQAKAGQLNFNFNSTVGFKDVSDRMKLTDAAGFKLLYDEQRANEGIAAYDYTNWTANTDWQDQIFQRGILNYNNLSVSGASENNKFYMGLGYTQEEGVIHYEKLNKITLSLNDELQVTDNLKFGVNFNGYRAQLPQERSVASAVRAAPIAPVYNDEYGLYHTLPDFQRAQIWNPLVDIYDRRNTAINREYRAVASVFGEVKFLENFSFKANFLADYGFNQGRSYSPLINVYNPEIEGESKIDQLNRITSVSQNQNIFTKVQSDWLLTYKNSFGDHNLTATAGWTTYYNSYETTNASRTQGSGAPIPNDPDKWYVGIGSSDTQQGDGSAWERTTLSFLARALYNYKGKYLLNGSFRRDGTSGFYKYGNQWQNFGAIGAGWVISDEEFMQDRSAINRLKLKGSWGILGNQNTGGNQYPLYPLLVAGNSAVFGDNIIPAYEPSYIPYRDLRWERVYAWEGGFELDAFDNRFSLDAVYYHKDTKGIIVTVPASLGVKAGLSNPGEVSNKGIELSTSWNQSFGDDMSLTIGGNLTTMDNKVNRLLDEGYDIVDGVSRTSVDYPIGYFYGYISDGIYQTNEELRVSPVHAGAKLGDIKFRDVDGNGEINDADRTIIGNPTPDLTYGISLNFTYKNFDIGTDFMGVYGNEIFRNWNRNAFAQFNFLEDRLERWHGEGTSNWEPIMDSGRANNRLASTYYIEDGSFFRLRNLQLGYNFDQKILDRLHLKSLRIFVNAQNVFTLRNSTGYTPEIGGSATSFGVDDGTYPVPAIYTFGVNLNF